MRRTFAVCIAAVCVALSAGCSDATTTSADAATTPDAWTPTDAVTVRDAATITDAGAVTDAAMVVDAGNGVTTTRRTMVGNPRWEVSDVQFFAAPVGTSRDTTPLQGELTRLFGPEHRTSGNGLVLTDGVSHAGPYATELSTRLAAGGVDPGERFTVAEWTAPRGLVFAYQLIPGAGAPTGTSPDSASGPIIPASAYPLRTSGVLFHDMAMVDSAFDSSIAPPVGVDGRSHAYVILAESTEFIAGAPGEYRFLLYLRDATGDGWDLLTIFTVR